MSYKEYRVHRGSLSLPSVHAESYRNAVACAERAHGAGCEVSDVEPDTDKEDES